MSASIPLLRRPALVLVAGLALVTLAGVPDAHTAERRAKPDLVVTKARLATKSGHDWVARGDTVKLHWQHRTTNAGKGAAGPSHTALRLVSPAGGAVRLDTKRVSPLPASAGEGWKGDVTTTFDDTYSFGTYRPTLCADVRDEVAEKHEDNNCKQAKRFSVVPSELTGRITGTAPFNSSGFPGVTMSWEGDVDVLLSDRQPDSATGEFDYVLAGSMTYTLSGTDGSTGCAWSGSGTYKLLNWATRFDLNSRDPLTYFAFDTIQPTWAFTDNTVCPGDTTVGHDSISPYVYGLPRWFDTGFVLQEWDGESHLEGTYTDGRAAGATTYTWDLHAR
jgi:hypothetical protein